MAGQPMAVISPGTGLGMACFVPGEVGRGRSSEGIQALSGEGGHATSSEDAQFLSGEGEQIQSGEGGHVLPSEGGHATVAAFDRETESAIAVLRARYGHVSAERVLSGAGLVNLYQAVAELEGVTTETPTPEQITRAGMNGSSERARRALDLFCALLGSVAGDMALTFGARGGVLLGGGIVPALVDYLPRSRFRAAFESKGRLRAYMEQVATRVIVRPDPAFLGLAALASTGCAERREP
jgi:glucokinase